MKKETLSSSVLALAFMAGLLVATVPVAGQSILIQIDQYNPNDVTFTATGNFATVNNSSQTELFGVDLISYFTASLPTTRSTISGTLTPAGTGTVAYNQWFSDNYLNGVNNLDLNLYVNHGSQTQTFTMSSAAFTGTTGINLASFLADLPATGTTGAIYSGYGRHPGVQIGSWIIVPEPSSLEQLALGGFMLSGLLVWRARRSVVRR